LSLSWLFFSHCQNDLRTGDMDVGQRAVVACLGLEQSRLGIENVNDSALPSSYFCRSMRKLSSACSTDLRSV
jgi:hypothetical protein